MDVREEQEAEYEAEHPSCRYCGLEILRTLAGWIHIETDARTCAETTVTVVTYASPNEVK